MSRFALAIDLGTSGFRAQAIDLKNSEIVSTAITTRHPMPGANVIDHLHFAIEMGLDSATHIVIDAVNTIIGKLQIPLNEVVRLAVCGNPIQLSLFQGIEIRDLAFAGKRKLEALGVVAPNRDAAVISAEQINGLLLPRECDVIIPPAVRHEIGADALAMMIKTGMLDRDETSLTTDYGTNAEMALFHEGSVITGSTAAGPALEGQQITCGMLAIPGAISDVFPELNYQRLMVLNHEMFSAVGPLVDFKSGLAIDNGVLQPIGITGTGTVAILSQGIESRLIKLPKIATLENELHLWDGIVFTEKDLKEAGKAIGSVRAGHITLCQEAGIGLDDIETAYMSGASGTYVDALKAQYLGMIPPRVKKVFQVGNTSLAMALDLSIDPRKLDEMDSLAKTLRQTHCMFASSKVFEKIYILELSYWTEGMPLAQYKQFLKKYNFPPLVDIESTPEVIKTVRRDIDDIGRLGLITIPEIGKLSKVHWSDCTGCLQCVQECNENAIQLDESSGSITLVLDQSLCNGVSCRRCERNCPEKCFELRSFFKKND